MLAVSHLSLPESGDSRALAEDLLGALAARQGFARGHLARALDDPGEWVLVTEWEDVGSYRRGLSAYDVKLAFAPLMAYIRNDTSAYEVVAAR